MITKRLALTILISLSFVTFADDFNDEEEVQSFGYKRFGKFIAVPDESAVSSRSIEMFFIVFFILLHISVLTCF